MVIKKCICQICTCGRHRCPHKPFGGPKGPCEFSEYHEQFRQKEIPKSLSFKPTKGPVTHNGPMDDKTTFRVDYVPHKIDKPFVRQPDTWRKPDGDMENMTSYRKEFIPKDMAPRKAFKQEAGRKVDGKFEGEPTYRSDYRKWQMPARQRGADPDTYAPPEAPFEGEPTYKRDYHSHPFSMRGSLRPNEAERGTGDPFDGSTGYREQYIKHSIPKRELRKKDEYAQPKVPMDGSTTQKADYTQKQAGKSRSFKPDNAGYASNAPFTDATTFRTDYKKWSSERPAPFKPEDWVKPPGEIDLQTTTRLHYDKKPINPVLPRKPEARRPVSATFDGHTTHKEDYRQWPLSGRNRPGARDNYVPPDVPFEGQSTFRAHYTPKQVGPPTSFKPANATNQSGPFDGTTMYRTDYIPKDMEPCPAAVLETGRSKFVYQNQEPTGHKFYSSAYQTITPLGPGIAGHMAKPNTTGVVFG